MSKNLGFTMAEILLSLTIIGVVAAITLPSLMANINERTWNTQRKALYARLSQAIAMMPQLNGYGEYEGTNTDGVVSATKDTAAEAFLTEGLSKVLKINNICDATHLADCGVAPAYVNLIGSTISWPKNLSELNNMFTDTYVWCEVSYVNPQKNINTNAAAFETLSGESVALYYNPSCQPDMDEISGHHYVQTKMCANFIYDLNGTKGPNTVGKDIGFISAIYPTDTVVVAPLPVKSTDVNNYLYPAALTICSSVDGRLPNRDEAVAFFINKELLGIKNAGLWTTSMAGNGQVWYQNIDAGYRQTWPRDEVRTRVRCVKR